MAETVSLDGASQNLSAQRSKVLERVGNFTGDATVKVSTPLATDAVFTLHFLAATQYFLTLEDSDAVLPINTEQHRSVSLKDIKTGLGVSGVSIRAVVQKSDNGAGIKPLEQDAITDPSGVARFAFSAAHTGSSLVLFTTKLAGALSVRLNASSHVTKALLSVPTPPMSVKRNETKKGDGLITIYLNPPDDEITEIEYQITPAKDNGLMLRDKDHQWSTHGRLLMAEGTTVVKEVKVGDNETAEYRIKFSVPGHPSSIQPATFVVALERGALALHAYPEGTTANRGFDLVSGAKIEKDPNLRVIAYKDTTEKVVARHVSLRFDLVSPPSAPSGAVSFDGGRRSAEASTDEEGECYVPPFSISNGYAGTFYIAVANVASSTYLAYLYFVVKQAADPKVIEFQDVHAKLSPSHPYTEGVGEVRVYSDDAKGHPVPSRSVRFAIIQAANMGATFRAASGHFGEDNGDPVLSQSVRLSAAGVAQIPAIKTKNRGVLTLSATVEGTQVSASQTFKVE